MAGGAAGFTGELTTVATIIRQVNRMVAFIELEGNEKVEAISNKTEEEYNLMVGNMIQNGRRQLVELYDRKLKSLLRDKNLEEQLKVNECKMKMLNCRQELVNDMIKEIEDKIKENADNEEFTREILYKCMLQSLVLVLEKEVIIQVVEKDYNIAKDLTEKLVDEFQKLTGIKCKIRIAKKHLNPNCMGGCITFNRKCSLKITNTLSERFQIISDDISVRIMRYMLFGWNTNRKFLD